MPLSCFNHNFLTSTKKTIDYLWAIIFVLCSDILYKKFKVIIVEKGNDLLFLNFQVLKYLN